MSVPSLADVKATLAGKANSLGITPGAKGGVGDFLLGYALDVIAQGIYDRAAKLLDDAKQVVYDSDNMHPHIVAQQASILVLPGTQVFGPYNRTTSWDRLFLCYWSGSNVAGLGIGPDSAGAVDVSIWIQRTANPNEFNISVTNNTGVGRNVEFSVVALRFP
jgi:hypothetical protein